MSQADDDDVYRHPWEKLASQYLEDLREGKNPSIEDLVAQCPDDERQVREMLQLVATMEGWKTRREFSAMRQTMPDLFRFERLGDCQILREIGRGGMGVVFEADQHSMKRRVAVKVLPWRIPKSSRLRERFQREACLAAKLRHKHIVPVYQFGEEDGWCYFVMHLVEGIGLDRVIKYLREPPHEIGADEILEEFQRRTRRAAPISDTEIKVPARTHRGGWFPWFRAAPPGTQTRRADGSWVYPHEAWNHIAKFGMQLADALRYAHAAGILHRDIKPGNVILDHHRRLWLADFGLAQLHDREAQQDQESVAGTLRYTPPEQLAGSPDARSDLYSLGMTLYELCTLQPAYLDRDRATLIKKVREELPPSPRELNPRCPQELSDIVMRLIAKNPDRRYQSAADLMNALVQYLRPEAPPAQTAPRRFWWWKR
ncbi:protein kinase [bacterium]|nr:protein kinase [bacterium]